MKRVLVVNNNLEFIEALAEGLTLKSYQVISCNKPQSLLAKIQKCTPDLIILDSETTDINTTALLNELFQYDPKIPSIVLWKAEEGKQKPEFENTPFVTSFVEKDGDIGKIIRNVQKLLPQFRFTDKFLIGDYHSAVGQTLGNCVLKRMLGSGGTGIVYLADHKVTKNPVAVKVLSPSLYNEPAAIMRFIREASVLASIDHPNIVKILDTDKQDGIYYLVMEYIHGTSLLELLKKKGKLPYQRATHIIRQAGSGLWAAHKKMILHRDLKPSNILISNEDHKVKIIDFGLARQVSCEEEITKEGIIIGTPGYIPPEQCLNQQLN
ncbi:MAG TPA: protein kinase, partial [Planctomycetota bacterium]|nr:protein kinase [Planctomycetota bacterium]